MEEKKTEEELSTKKRKRKSHRFLGGFAAGAVCMLAVSLGLNAYTFGGIYIPVPVFRRAQTAQSGTQAQTASPSDAGSSAPDYTKVAQKLRLLQAYLDRYYLYDENAQAVEDGIYKGMIGGLSEEDPYAAYYTADELKEFTENNTGEYVGIGVLVTQTTDPKQTVVVRVYEGSPAEEAGMLPGDVLYKVNGIDITQMDLDYVVTNMIKGESGSYLDITVRREGEADPVTLHCERRAVETPTVASKMLDDNIGYVLLAQFNGVGLGQFEEAVESLKDQGMEKLIVDLRGNPGGDVNTATGLLDYILPDDITTFTEGKSEFEQGKTLLVYMQNKQGEMETWYAKDGQSLDMPIAVLVNENSASASELFSGCLQDYGKATIVGTTTFGKGIAQMTFPLEDGSAVEFTTDNYYLPSGQSVHKRGVLPDVQVELDEALKQKTSITIEEDNQLQKAIEVLKTTPRS